ncbi:Uncharacterised protein r2_g3120 [Pycnogonum litorale]
METHLSKIYYNPSHPAAFGSVRKLVDDCRKHGFSASEKRVSAWLMSQDPYTLHKRIKRNFKRNRVIVSSIHEQWEIDLMEVSNLKTYNDNLTFILIVIDVLSKYAWAVPLTNKTNAQVCRAFKKILKFRKPLRVHSDKGSEFTGKPFQNLLKSENIGFFTTHNNTKASVVERVIRTIRQKLARYFTANNTRRYIEGGTWRVITKPSTV